MNTSSRACQWSQPTPRIFQKGGPITSTGKPSLPCVRPLSEICPQRPSGGREAHMGSQNG